MNPSDAMKQDYPIYYDGCWMEHHKHGIGRVNVVDGDMYLSPIKGKSLGAAIKVRPSALVCWWPRPGAFNCNDGAVYIARRSIRNMRKSAVSNDHYLFKWGTSHGQDVMIILQAGPNPIPMTKARRMLMDSSMYSVAITRDIIILPEDRPSIDTQVVIFRGVEAGKLINGSYEPLFSGHPLGFRIMRQLEAI